MEQSMKTVTNVAGLKCYQCARLQKAYALLAAAEGAAHAYAHVTGEAWKPYQPAIANPRTVGRQAARTEMEAFNA
jgi:hypothetical protein